METYDLIILGGGLAGMCAAVEAGEAGATSFYLKNRMNLAVVRFLVQDIWPLPEQICRRSAGINDTTESLMDDMIEVGGGVNDSRPC